MATVYEAEHTMLNRKVAVKVMHEEVATLPGAVDRFFLEAQAASSIGHPNIIEIFHVGKEDDGTLYIVEELLNGLNLGDFMEKTGRLTPRSTAVITLQVLSGLAAAHAKGIIHRDMKPDNIYLAIDNRKRQEVKLLDFGIAKVQQNESDGGGLTQAGTVLGTPKYMSPEQARAKEIDARTDIWAVGVIMYEMLSGRPPFSGESYNEVLSEILLEDPTPLRDLVPDLPDPIVRIVERAMRKNRDERYSKASDMMNELLPFVKKLESAMTTSAVQAMKDSLAPPPANAPNRAVATPPRPGTASDTVELSPSPTPQQTPLENRRQSFERREMLLDSQQNADRREIALDQSDIADRRYSTDRRENGDRRTVESAESKIFKRRTKQFLIRLGIVLVVLLIIYRFIPKDYTAEGEPKGLWDHAVELWQGGIVQEIPAAKRPNMDNPNEGQLDQGKKPNQDASDKPALPAKVKIKIAGLPRRASMTIEEKKVKSPLVLPRSDKPVTLMIVAKGYYPLEKTLIPDGDHTLKLSMLKKQKRKRKRSRSKRKRR